MRTAVGCAAPDPHGVVEQIALLSPEDLAELKARLLELFEVDFVPTPPDRVE